MKSLRKLAMAAAAAAVGVYSALATPAATHCTYSLNGNQPYFDDASVSALLPADDNLLRGLTPVAVEGAIRGPYGNEDGNGGRTYYEIQPKSPACLTDGAIPTHEDTSNWNKESNARWLVSDDSTLTWSFEEPQDLADVRLWTQWPDGNRNDIAVSAIQVTTDGTTWTTLPNSSFCSGKSNGDAVVKNTIQPTLDSSTHFRMVTYANEKEDPLATGITGLRIVFPDQELGYTCYWEIEAGRSRPFSVMNTVNGRTDYVGIGEVVVSRMPYKTGYEEYQFTVSDNEPATDGWKTYTPGTVPADVITFTLPQTLDAEITVHCRLRGTELPDLDFTDTIKSAYGAQPTASVSGGISVQMANDYDGARVTAAQLTALSTSSDSHGGIVSVTAEDAVVYGNTNLVLTVTNLAGNSATCNVPVTATVAGGALPASVFKTMLHLGEDVVNDSLTVHQDGPGHDYLSGFGGQANQLPYAGLTYSGLSTVETATTPGTLVWTAVEDDDGIWLDNVDRFNNFIKYWHIYVYSPVERDVTWRMKSDDYAYVFVNGEQQGFSEWTANDYITSEGHLKKGFNSITVKFYENGGGEYVSVGLFHRGTSTFLSDLTYSLEPPFLVKDAETGDIRKLTSGTVKVAYLPRVRDVTHYQIVQDNFFGDAEAASDGWLAYTPGEPPTGTIPCNFTAEDDKVYYTVFFRKDDGTVVRKETASLVSGVRVGNVTAVGATSSTAGSGDVVFTFSESGSIRFAKDTTVDVLVVGGGGGGGNGGYSGGGGGGAGGVVYSQGVRLEAGEYNVYVGQGGAEGMHGAASSFAEITALGGGGGYQGMGDASEVANGASGGGACAVSNWERSKGLGTLGQGHDGGLNLRSVIVADYAAGNLATDVVRNGFNQDINAGGGGGGAGAPGGTGSYSVSESTADKITCDKWYAGNGGDGIVCAITGSDVYYGGGGGGGLLGWYQAGNESSGGQGGGGKGGYYNDPNKVDGENGVDGLGGGGGGGGSRENPDFASHGGRGGNGVVIIRFTPEYSSDSKPARGGNTVVKKDGWMIHTFTESGKFSIPNSVVGQVLLVGGGGGGGNGYGAAGGGGAGGMLVVSEADIPAGNYEVTVGLGGEGGRRGLHEDGMNGGDSMFAGWTAFGGGGGAGIYHAASKGGSGGGAYYTELFKNDESGAAGTEGQGHDGGSNTYVEGSRISAFGAGGGGAGEAGYSSSVNGPGKGGDGLMCDFSGEEKWYAGGGAGGGNANAGREETQAKGGKGGGGDSGYWPTGVDIVDHYGPSDNMAYVGHAENGTGGGGGGGAIWGNGSDQGPGGNGGSGIVIIRYKLEPVGFGLFVR